MSRARKIWDGWVQFNKDVAAFQGRLWMALVYFLVLGPIALLVRISGNPMLPPYDHPTKPTEGLAGAPVLGDSFSHERKAAEPTLEDARRQGA